MSFGKKRKVRFWVVINSSPVNHLDNQNDRRLCILIRLFESYFRNFLFSCKDPVHAASLLCQLVVVC